MVAFITSTIYPPSATYQNAISPYSNSERLLQTIETVQSLKKSGISKIILIDNSESKYQDIIKSHFTDTILISINQYQFKNRGLTEILMLLCALSQIELKEDEPILKISGRYLLTGEITSINADFKFKGYNYKNNTGTVSTRCYLVKNKEVYIKLLKLALSEIYRYSLRSVGIRSVLAYLYQLIRPSSIDEPTMSIEMAICKVLKYHKYEVEIVEKIGVEGYIGGNKTFISE